jgi:3-oxoadipate enol-lactonase
VSTVELNHAISGRASGPPLLLGGSLGTNLTMWEPQVRVLSERFRVVAFDQRGHGSSPSPRGPYSIADLGRDVVALMDRLELESAFYVGLSIGGMAGIWLGAEAPERIRRMVLMCTSAHAPAASNWIERAQKVRDAGTPEVIADAVVARWFTPDWSHSHAEEVARHRAMIAATDADGYASCCEAIATMDLREALPRVSAPTLGISAAEDLALPPEHQRLIAAGIPGARLETIENAAHIVSAQHPETVNRLIEEHLPA